MATENRPVSNFDRIHLRDFGELVITQGEQEALTVEADPEILAKVVTEVNAGRLTLGLQGDWWDKLGMALRMVERPHLKFVLALKNLAAIEFSGLGRIQASALRTENLDLALSGAGLIELAALTSGRVVIKLSGAGNVQIGALSAQSLESTLSGAGNLEARGTAEDVRVTVSGAGSFQGGHLQAQRARVTMSGLGNAVVWSEKELDATLSGIGSVEYYGNPQLSRHASGIGSIRGLGNR